MYTMLIFVGVLMNGPNVVSNSITTLSDFRSERDCIEAGKKIESFLSAGPKTAKTLCVKVGIGVGTAMTYPYTYFQNSISCVKGDRD